MKPDIDVNYEEALENTEFLNEVNSIAFGAELALKYAGAFGGQFEPVIGRIVRSAFMPFKMNYESMYTDARQNRRRGG